MTKTDLKAMEPTPEEVLISGVRTPLLASWKPGRRFLVTDNRASLIFDKDNIAGLSADSLAGRELIFTGTHGRMSPGGEMVTVIEFSDGNHDYFYSTGRRQDAAGSSISVLDIPMLIDLGMVADADSLLRGKKVWTLSQLCYDTDGNRLNGLKFFPVTIQSVKPGNSLFTLTVDASAENGETRRFLMNIRNNGMESRTFPSLFSLSDPKLKYPSVSAETWRNIQAGVVRNGMTKEECKLALGNPDDVDTGHDWNQTVDLWHYSDGRWLRFSDGLLVAYRM